MQTFILLQAQGGQSMVSMLLPFLLIMVVFYFFFIRPANKRQKEQGKFNDSLEKGQEVATASGILGRINKIEGDIITLDLGNKVYIRVTKTAISKEMTDSIFGKGSKAGPIEVKE